MFAHYAILLHTHNTIVNTFGHYILKQTPDILILKMHINLLKQIGVIEFKFLKPTLASLYLLKPRNLGTYQVNVTPV